MNGHEKSDPAIVAVKPANKAERSVAEPVEGEAGAETFDDVEGNMCGVVMRDADAPPRSKTPSRANRQCRNLGGLMSGPAASAARVRVGKARSRSR